MPVARVPLKISVLLVFIAQTACHPVVALPVLSSIFIRFLYYSRLKLCAKNKMFRKFRRTFKCTIDQTKCIRTWMTCFFRTSIVVFRSAVFGITFCILLPVFYSVLYQRVSCIAISARFLLQFGFCSPHRVPQIVVLPGGC